MLYCVEVCFLHSIVQIMTHVPARGPSTPGLWTIRFFVFSISIGVCKTTFEEFSNTFGMSMSRIYLIYYCIFGNLDRCPGHEDGRDLG